MLDVVFCSASSECYISMTLPKCVLHFTAYKDLLLAIKYVVGLEGVIMLNDSSTW